VKDLGAAEAFRRHVEIGLRMGNDEYANKRDSHRLGEVRLKLLPAGFWAEWDRQRLAKSGGTSEQYKHPCLIPDPEFFRSVPTN
jgi:hypothetical protein